MQMPFMQWSVLALCGPLPLLGWAFLLGGGTFTVTVTITVTVTVSDIPLVSRCVSSFWANGLKKPLPCPHLCILSNARNIEKINIQLNIIKQLNKTEKHKERIHKPWRGALGPLGPLWVLRGHWQFRCPHWDLHLLVLLLDLLDHLPLHLPLHLLLLLLLFPTGVERD